MHNVWALAIGFGSESAFRCVLSYILYPGFPSITWNRDAIRDLYDFSKQAFGLSFLNLIFSRTDIFVLGKLYPATELGLYFDGRSSHNDPICLPYKYDCANALPRANPRSR